MGDILIKNRQISQIFSIDGTDKRKDFSIERTDKQKDFSIERTDKRMRDRQTDKVAPL